MGSAVPETGKQTPTRWRIDNWNLRAKVAAVLALPAIIALVLGGARVQSRLDDANRLSTVRDQMVVLGESVALADLVVDEMVVAVTNDRTKRPELAARRAAVDDQVVKVRDAVDSARLPADVDRILSNSLGRLSAVRVQTSNDVGDPVTDLAAYQEVVNGLTELVPGVVEVAQSGDLDEMSTSVRSLLLLRSALAAETALIQSANGPGDRTIAVAAQQHAAEEAVRGEQLQLDLPRASADAFADATESAAARRATLQVAELGTQTVDLRALLPDLRAESTRMRELSSGLVDSMGGMLSARTNDARADALRDSAIVLAALLTALAVALLVGRSLVSPVRRLRSAALDAAQHQLPTTVERVRAGEPVDWTSVQPVPVHTTEEIGQLARAFDDMHVQAVRLAGEQAELRRQVSEMFMTLSRRSQTLVESQLEVIESLEADEQEPRRLAGLFRLDHLATRLRRNGENLQVLAGGSPARRDRTPVTVVQVLRAATSEVDDYRRISLGHAPNASVRAAAAADVVHILSELLENATRYSPPDRKVVLSADRGSDGGLLFEVVDAGLGMAPDDVAAANERLAATDAVGPETTRRMGLFVISRLAARHGVTVRLRPTFDTPSQAGITASIHLPGALVVAGTAAETMAIVVEAPVARAAIAAPPAVEAWPAAVVAPGTSSWFIEMDKPAGNGDGSGKWLTPAVSVPKAAEPAVATQPATQPARQPARQSAGTTAAGLPVRTPASRAVPAERAPDESRAFRDPESIRTNLSRHYDGVRAARRARDESGSSDGGAT